MDTKLADPSFLLEVHGAEIPQGRVPACRIIEALDIVEHIGPSLTPRSVGFSRDALGFARGTLPDEGPCVFGYARAGPLGGPQKAAAA